MSLPAAGQSRENVGWLMPNSDDSVFASAGWRVKRRRSVAILSSILIFFIEDE
jgi:hypothetical protein